MNVACVVMYMMTMIVLNVSKEGIICKVRIKVMFATETIVFNAMKVKRSL